MKRDWKRATGKFALAALVLSSLLNVSTAPANATLTSAEIRLVTPSIIPGTNAWSGQADMDSWIGNTWYAAGSTWARVWTPVGSSVVITYFASDPATGAPLADTVVKLRVNKGYSGSNALVKVGSSAIASGIERGTGVDQLQVTATTDQFGYVTFVLEDTDTVGPAQPASLTDAPPTNTLYDPTISLYSQVFPEITGQGTDKADMVEFQYYTPGGSALVSNDLSSTTARLAGPVPTDTNAVHRTDLETEFSVNHDWYAQGIKVYQKYHKVNTTSNLVYTVKDDNGAWVANTNVTLSVGKAYSSSNAHVTNGTTATNTGAAADADQATWTATTDPFGTVLFKLTNTDTSGEAVPASLSTATPETGALYSQIWPVVAGTSSNIADMLEYHFYTPPAPPAPQVTAITQSVSARKLTVTVRYPKNKTVAITVGSYTFSNKPAVGQTTATYTISVPKGTHKVTVVCNGKKSVKTYKVK
ncbi:MAG: hypothetical protein RL410_50 [Actinomycetota bacterium]